MMRGMWRNVILVGLVWAILCAGIGLPGQPMQVAHAQTSDEIAPSFGIIGAADMATLDQLGVGWLQLPFSWAAFQPDSAEDWRDDAVDADLIAAVIDSGREVIGVITDTPIWASASGQPYAVPDGLWTADSGNVWAAFMQRLVTEYAPLGVHHWIIYDEPNVRLGEGRVRFAGDVAAYARLLKVAYIIAKTLDRNAVIHLGALNWWVDDAAGRAPYLARLLRAINADPDAAERGYYFDVVTVRVTGNTAAVGTEIADARAQLDAAGIDTHPIWLEASAQPDTPGGSAALAITPTQAADFVIQATALGFALGAERIAFAGLHHPRGGMFSPAHVLHDVERLPAFDAYRTVIDLLSSTQRITHHPHRAAELIVFEGADRDVYVMWATDEWPLLFAITSNMENETATLLTLHNPPTEIASQVIGWPAEFRVDIAPARPDANGFLSVAGSPVLLILDQPMDGDVPFVRVTTMELNGNWVRLR